MKPKVVVSKFSQKVVVVICEEKASRMNIQMKIRASGTLEKGYFLKQKSIIQS